MGFERRGGAGGGWIEQAYTNSVMEQALEALGFETPRVRLKRLEAKLAAMEQAGAAPGNLREVAAEKLGRGQPLTRDEAASYLSVSTKKLQRMEASGRLVRCPNMGSVVRYAARDVLRLASAR